MHIEQLYKIRNKNTEQQNRITFLEMEKCSKSLSHFPWLHKFLVESGHSQESGILISLTDSISQGGTIWYGTWLAFDKTFYEFEVFTDHKCTKILEIESWQTVYPDISEHKKGIGKSAGFIALEVLAKHNES